MTRILAIRHGPTVWNLEGRLQGRTNVELAPEAADYISALKLPEPFSAARCFASPLDRTMETARRVGLEPIAEPALIEMGWGDWEGLKLSEVTDLLDPSRRHFGLHYAAPNGESPRQVQTRLQDFLNQRAADGTDAVLVTHKGVIRALYALAVGWTMETKPPDKLDLTAGQLFSLDGEGRLDVVRLNLPLDGHPI
ncbi:MAG: histidine phosphatase family protein [Pseudomonadota bacterium]